MSTDQCAYPVIGRFIAVGLFLADNCGKPIAGADSGWIDWCPAALSMEDDITEGDAFQRTCANGKVLTDIPGEQSFVGIDVNLDLHGVDPSFIAAAGNGTEVTQNSTVVGWDTCRDGAGSLSMYLWREIAGDAACDPAGPGKQYLLTVLPWVDQVRITEEGTFGGDDGFMRVTGRARFGHGFDTGPLAVFPDPATPTDPPVKFDQAVDPSCLRRTVFTPLAPPDSCGIVAVT